MTLRQCLVLLILVRILSSLTPVAAAEESEDRNRIVAVVNQEVITAGDVAQAMAPLYGQYRTVYSSEELPVKISEAETKIVDLLIEERLMLQEARNPRQIEVAKGRWATPPPIMVSDEELADAIEEVRARFPSEEEFHQVLAAHGMTMKDLEARTRDQLAIQQLVDREVRSRIVISPSEITSTYQAHMEEYKSPEAVRLSNLLIRVGGTVSEEQAKTKARDLWQALKAGADFSELARKHSEGPNADGGGVIGWVTRGRLMPEIEGAVFALEPGEISPVVRSSLGYHIFRMEERRPPHTKPIAEVQKEIRDALYREKFLQRYTEWIGKLKERAYISVKS